MKKTLPSLRVEEKTINNIHSAIQEFNKTSLIQLSISEFRRLSYELLSQMILQKISIPVKILPK